MKTQRLLSLDAFRGFTIAAMLLVNNPGDWGHLYSQLAHAKWNGWTFTDWIFPFFLFICGVSMQLSVRRLTLAGSSRGKLLKKLVWRAGIVFGIGLGLNLYPHFDLGSVRIPGVLQRIALCTVLAAPIVLYFRWRQQCAWIIALLGLYSVVMLLPVPGAQVGGVLEPGRDFGAFVDRTLLDGHLWSASKTWDPEGLVSTLPALCSLLFGGLVGHWLATDQAKTERTVWMLLTGLAGLWLGSILDVTFMPINKSLWTVSYCIFMTGWALIVFSTFYWLLDANGSPELTRRLTRLLQPCVIFGLNSLFIFALSGLIAKTLGAIKLTQADGTTLSLKALLYAPLQALPITAVNASLLFALLFLLTLFGVAWFMWRRRWFVKV